MKGRDRSSSGQLSRLEEFTRRTLQMNVSEKPGPQLAALLHQLFDFDAVALFDADLGEVYQAGDWTADPGEEVQNAYHFESSTDDPVSGISRRVIRLGAVPIGSFMLRGYAHPLANNMLAGIVAITFDRYRASANESRIEAEREAEQMRSTVLDNLAHAYKTPLTAIRAASSGLSEMGRLSPSQADLVSLIDEQAELLNTLTTRLLTTARIGASEGGPATPLLNMESHSVADLIASAISAMGERAQGANIQTALEEPNLTLKCDRKLVSMMLTQYIDNACKYSNAGSQITVEARRVAAEVIFSVNSFGPVIPIADRERIFDRYYRSANSSTRAAGTGIGLSISKRAALAHKGAVWVSSDEQEGTTFSASIPDQDPQQSTTNSDPAHDRQHRSEA